MMTRLESQAEKQSAHTEQNTMHVVHRHAINHVVCRQPWWSFHSKFLLFQKKNHYNYCMLLKVSKESITVLLVNNLTLPMALNMFPGLNSIKNVRGQANTLFFWLTGESIDFLICSHVSVCVLPGPAECRDTHEYGWFYWEWRFPLHEHFVNSSQARQDQNSLGVIIIH